MSRVDLGTIIPHIVEQHAEEAAFLWLLRADAVRAPHYDLKDLTRLDERVEAHIDGLRVAGEPGWEIMLDELARHEEAGEVFTAGVLALESQAPAKIDRIIETVEGTPETARGFISAMGWVDPRRLKGKIQALLEDDDRAICRLLGLAACSVHRVDANAHLPRLAADDDASVRARALRLIGEVGAVEMAHRLRGAIEDEDDACRFWAAWSAALIGERASAFPTLRRHAEADGPFKWRALDVLLRSLPRADAMAWLSDLNGDPEHARLAVTGAGILGDPRFVPWLIDRMTVPELARPAGESFSLITGIDLAYDDLDGDAPEGAEPGPSADPADPDVQMDLDEDLPWPAPPLIQAWWRENADCFAPGHRHFLGQAFSPDRCRRALATAYQRQRRAASLDLALEQPEAALFNCSQTGKSQQRSLPSQA